MSTYQEVLFEVLPGRGGDLAVITLNRPEVLNALNHGMVNAMYPQLKTWAQMPSIKAVVIKAAEGRAFCAGGDLRLTHDRNKANDPAMAHFFRDEYQLNRLIFHYPKPYIAILDGITMGGGVGISIHGSHRVVTDKLLFAMPETGIGFFPDVGGTYFLPRLPGKVGIYLGLTGKRIHADDSVAVGVATHKISRDAIADFMEQLIQQPMNQMASKAAACQTVNQLLQAFKIDITSSQLKDQQKVIDAVFAGKDMEAIVEQLKQAQTDPFSQETLSALEKKSPTSLKVSLRAMHEGATLDFDACMRQEYRLASRFLEGHDFPEGIRAVIIEKDQKPAWQPPTLADVSKAEVEKYFTPLTEELSL